MAARDELIGATIDGRYHIVRQLGKGGMGHVYEGLHVALDRKVAIKVLHPRLAHEEKFRERFLREARAASKIRHPNVVQILDFGETSDGQAYFAMEFLDGRDLRSIIRQDGPMRWPQARHILQQATSALAAAHGRSIIHRDIKPANCVLCAPDDRGGAQVVKLLDFGIAKIVVEEDDDDSLTGTGEVFGTATYMAPEQAHGMALDARSDIYSLGIMAYEMLVGRPPFTGSNPIQIITRHISEVPKPLRAHDPSIPVDVEALVLCAIAKHPDQRFDSMAAFGQAVTTIPANANASTTLARKGRAPRSTLPAYGRIKAPAPRKTPEFSPPPSPLTEVAVVPARDASEGDPNSVTTPDRGSVAPSRVGAGNPKSVTAPSSASAGEPSSAAASSERGKPRTVTAPSSAGSGEPSSAATPGSVQGKPRRVTVPSNAGLGEPSPVAAPGSVQGKPRRVTVPSNAGLGEPSPVAAPGSVQGKPRRVTVPSNASLGEPSSVATPGSVQGKPRMTTVPSSAGLGEPSLVATPGSVQGKPRRVTVPSNASLGEPSSAATPGSVQGKPRRVTVPSNASLGEPSSVATPASSVRGKPRTVTAPSMSGEDPSSAAGSSVRGKPRTVTAPSSAGLGDPSAAGPPSNGRDKPRTVTAPSMSEDDLSSAAAASAEAPSSGREGKPRTVTAPSPGREDTPEPQSVTAPSGESWNIPDSVVAASSRVSEDDLSSIVAAKSASDQGSVASSDSTRPPDNEPDLATAPFSSGSLTLGEIDEPDQGETSPGSITIERPVHNRAWLLAMGGALVLGLGGAGAWVAFGGEQEPASETARAQIDDGPEVRRDASIPGSVDGSSGSAVPAPEPSDEQPSGSSGLSGPDEAPSSSPAARPPVESTTRSSAAKPKATAPDTSPPKTEEPVGSATEAEPATTPAKPKSKSKPKSKPKTDASVRSQLIQKIKKKCRSGNEGSSILVEATVGSSGAILTKIIEGPSAAKSCVGRQIGAVSFPEGSVRQIKLSIDL